MRRSLAIFGPMVVTANSRSDNRESQWARRAGSLAVAFAATELPRPAGATRWTSLRPPSGGAASESPSLREGGDRLRGPGKDEEEEEEEEELPSCHEDMTLPWTTLGGTPRRLREGRGL